MYFLLASTPFPSIILADTMMPDTASTALFNTMRKVVSFRERKIILPLDSTGQHNHALIDSEKVLIGHLLTHASSHGVIFFVAFG